MADIPYDDFNNKEGTERELGTPGETRLAGMEFGHDPYNE